MTDVLERPRVASPAARTRTQARPERDGGVGHAPRRVDIEGLRAVAVLGVLGFHAGLPFLPGGYVGVDVFFVISGFLITGLVAAEVELTGRLSFSRFYARRIKRLLPAAVLVLLVTSVASALLLSPLARREAGGDIVSAALYVSNWHFAAQQTDYLAVQSNPSPVLHYWSLSVEEQYYVLWPVVLLLTALLARRYRLVTRRAVQIAVVLVGVVSLAWSLLWTTSNPPFAFFGLMTRAWELALGGVIALTAVGLARLPGWTRAALGWAGLAAVAWSMLVLTEDVPFPGTAALVPVLGAGAVLVAGLPRTGSYGIGAQDQGPHLGPARVLGTRPMRSVGRVSYSLYLWHWPPLVLVPVALGVDLNPYLGVLVVLASCVPAVLSYRYVEEPFRHSTALVTFPRRAGVVAAVLTAVAVGAAVMVAATAPEPRITVLVPTKQEASSPDRSGRGAPPATQSPQVRAVTVDPESARDDVPAMYADGCEAGYSTTSPERCVYGDKTSSRRVAMLGDSHMAQWFPALVKVARAEGFALEVDSKAACTAADVLQWRDNVGGDYDTCVTFRDAILDQWANDPRTRPDLVVVTSRNVLTVVQDGRQLSAADSLTAARDGMVRTFDRLHQMGIEVVVIRDLPQPLYDVPDCLAEHSDDLARCDYRASDTAPPSYADVEAAQAAGVPVVDLTDQVCQPDGVCPAIIDGHIVYRDNHHLTASFVQTLARPLRTALQVVPEWDEVIRT